MPDNFFSSIRHWFGVDPNPVSHAEKAVVVALTFNYLFKWRRYPLALHSRHAPPKDKPESIQIEDIEHALHILDTPVDVTEDELQYIYQLAREHAVKRRIILDQKKNRE